MNPRIARSSETLAGPHSRQQCRIAPALRRRARVPAPSAGRETIPPTPTGRPPCSRSSDTTQKFPRSHDPRPAEREVEAPLESRARLVASPQVEVEEVDSEDVMELDDRHVVQEEVVVVEESIELAQTVEAKGLDQEEEPPPSSRRPIAEPAETPQEAQIQVAHTPPPESGKQVAADALSFDDDFTGVREMGTKVELPKPEASIQLESLRSPAIPTPAVPDELEADLPGNEAPSPPEEPTRQPPGPLMAEITRPTRPVAASHVARTCPPASAPGRDKNTKTFGELLDLTLLL